MQDYFLHSRGIAYRTNARKAERLTLVFIHGFSGSASAWQPFEEKLQSEYNIITFDVRGHGFSVHPNTFEGYSVEKSVRDIHALLQHLHIPRCILISHSLGTLIALRFTISHPAFVEKAIFLSPVYGIEKLWRVRATRLLVWHAAALMRALHFFVFMKRGRRTAYATFRGTGDWSLSRMYTDITNMGIRSALWSLAQIYAQRSDDIWKKISAPTLLIHGEHDSVIPLHNVRTLATHMPHVQLEVVAGGNHILVLNNIDEVIQDITSFVKQ
jgi:pimeloyl-ACP methyl ester carboxylesterase